MVCQSLGVMSAIVKEAIHHRCGIFERQETNETLQQGDFQHDQVSIHE